MNRINWKNWNKKTLKKVLTKQKYGVIIKKYYV